MPNLVTDVNAVSRGQVGLGVYGSTKNNHTGNGVTHISDEDVSLLTAGERNAAIGDESYVHDTVEMDAEQDDLLAARSEDNDEIGLFPVEDRDGSNIYLLENPETGERYRHVGGDDHDVLVSLKTGRMYTLDEVPPFNLVSFKKLLKQKAERMQDEYIASCFHPFYDYHFDHVVEQQATQTRSEALAVSSGRSVARGQVMDRKHQQFFGNLRIH